jgi:DNA-binding NtrC family response regulator
VLYPYGGEEQQRFEKFLEIVAEADKLFLEKLLKAGEQQKQAIDGQIEDCDKKVFSRVVKRSARRYNLTQTARVLGVHRQTLYYWMKKGWINPRRDYRNYPVFTVLDIENLIKWKNTTRTTGLCHMRPSV